MHFMTQLIAAAGLVCGGCAAMANDCPPAQAATQSASAPASGSKLTRAQVMAETREAIRLGLIPQVAEIQPPRMATAEENELIRLAGLRAVGKVDAVASK